MTALVWLESTNLARAIGGSLPLTAGLSAVHFIGFTLVCGTAFVTHMRLVGATLQRTALLDVARPAGRLIALGLVVSVVTGALLFSGRASSIAANGIFQSKMALLAVAVAWQLIVQRRLARPTALSPHAMHAIGFVGLTLWLALAVTACAFILLE